MVLADRAKWSSFSSKQSLCRTLWLIKNPGWLVLADRANWSSFSSKQSPCRTLWLNKTPGWLVLADTANWSSFSSKQRPCRTLWVNKNPGWLVLADTANWSSFFSKQSPWRIGKQNNLYNNLPLFNFLDNGWGPNHICLCWQATVCFLLLFIKHTRWQHLTLTNNA